MMLKFFEWIAPFRWSSIALVLVSSSLSGQGLKVETYRLENGLTVFYTKIIQGLRFSAQ
jgi:hypothetical protein